MSAGAEGAKALLEKGDRLRAKSRFDEALAVYREALASAGRGGDPELHVECLIAVGDTLRMTGGFHDSVAYYEDAVARSCGPDALWGRGLDATVGLALSYRAAGDWAQSLDLLGQAGEAYRADDDMEGLAFTLWARGGAFRIRGRIDEAIEDFRLAKDIFKRIGDDSGLGYAYCGLGGASRVKGAYGRSLGYYERAGAVFAALDDTFGIAYSHCGRGNAIRMKGDYKAAMGHFKEAMKLYTKIGDIVSSAYTLWSMCKAEMMMGRLEASAGHLAGALERFTRTRDPRGLLYHEMCRGELMYLAGDKGAAGAVLGAATGRARAAGFLVEHCHLSTLLEAASEEPALGCYRELGIRAMPLQIPMNIP